MTDATRVVTIGTRGSALARWQSEHVAVLLQVAEAGLQVETQLISTRGDRELDKPLPEIGGKGLFTAELEAALLSGQIALAVHSLKDLPTKDAPGLTIGATPQRADPSDVLVSRHGLPLAKLPSNPKIGTSSQRRGAQIRLARPDAEVVPIRGNVDTRIRKAQTEDYDAVVLAAAGLMRLGLEEYIAEKLAFETMLPAPGQGALALHCRADDDSLLELLAAIHHEETWAAVTAERAFLAALGGGCSLPVGAYASVQGETMLLEGLVAAPDGSSSIRVEVEGSPNNPQVLGETAARRAIEQGAADLLEGVL